MFTVVIVVHLLIAIALVGVILLQRSEGGGLGMGGGGGGGMGGFMTGRATANLLTRTTGILAACFMATSLTLALMSGGTREKGSILDEPAPAAVEEAPSEPEKPEGPSVPMGK